MPPSARQFLKDLFLGVFLMCGGCAAQEARDKTTPAETAHGKKDSRERVQRPDSKNKQDPPKLPEHLQRWLERSELEAQRINGVRIRATVRAKPVKDDAEIHLDWEVDYLGPRPPLTIVRPSLHNRRCQTYAQFYAIAADEKSYLVTFTGPPIRGIADPLERKDFLRLQLGEVATGTITVKASELWKELRNQWPQQFGEGEPKLLFVRLEHSPGERGGDLDAWTGTARSNLMDLSLSSLKVPPVALPPRNATYEMPFDAWQRGSSGKGIRRLK